MKTNSLLALTAALLFPCLAQAETHRSRTFTGPQGNTTTRNITGSFVPGSGYTRTGEITGPNGQTASRSRTTTATPYGRHTQSSVQGPNGKTASASFHRGRWGHVRGGSVTGPEGNTRRFLRIR